MTSVSFSTPAASLIVPIGPAGSGKSTLLNQVATALGDPGFRFGNDDVRLLCGGVFVLGASGQVAHAARSLVAARLAHGLPAALDCTHTSEKVRATAITLAHNAHAKAIALLCVVPLAEVQRRNVARDVSLHVPRAVVATMAAATQELTPKALLAEGFDAVYTFDEHVTDLEIFFTTEEAPS
jgi:predicted kinase